MIEIILTLSLLTNGFLVWYILQLLRRFLAFQEELDEFSVKLEEYEGHIEIINNLERFYGDTTLSNLLRHSKDMTRQCKEFQNLLKDQEEEDYAEEAQ